MGIGHNIRQFEQESLNKVGWRYDGLNWCELGNQKYHVEKGRDIPSKQLYESLGVNHISIDLNGLDGAYPLDLEKPLPFEFLNQFDVVTNYGTAEHVNDQYELFKNIHNICKTGGIIVHVFPYAGHWPKHCRYYYTKRFVKGLSKTCKYPILNCTVLNKRPRKLVAAALYKKYDAPFISKSDFNSISGVVDSGNLSRTGNYGHDSKSSAKLS